VNLLSSPRRVGGHDPAVREFTEGKFVVMATSLGIIKKTELMDTPAAAAASSPSG